MGEIGENLRRLREQVARLAMDCGRSPDSVRILAVSKTFPAERVAEAVAEGQLRFGENRVQEARDKIPAVPGVNLEWHLIGHLQSNKARAAAEIFDFVQTVESEKLAVRLDDSASRIGKVLPVLIEVNVGGEDQKSGVSFEELDGLAEAVDRLPGLDLRGLMAIPPWSEDPEATRPYFRTLFRHFERLNRGRARPLTELSMGMSGDFPAAIQEGATLIRLGTAIFGRRTP